MNYSVNFVIYDSDGVAYQFATEAETVTEHLERLSALRSMLRNAGYMPKPPDPNAPKPKRWEIGGYVVGACNKPNGDEMQPCVWLYGANEKLEYRATTVYPEHFGDLPFTVGKPAWDGVAPDKTTARKRRVYVECAPFTIEEVPMMNFDGTPLLTENGQQRYKFARVVNGGSASLPTSLADVPAMPGGQPEEPAAKPTNGKAQPANGAAKPEPAQIASEKTLKRLHALGRDFYGNAWDEQRRRLVVWMGNQRIPAASITSSRELAEAEAAHLADGIASKISARNAVQAGQEYIDAHTPQPQAAEIPA